MCRRLLAAAVVLAALASGCSGGSGDGGGGEKASVDTVASFLPLVEATRAVGGDRVGVVNLTPPGAEPHDIELTPKQIDRIATADLLVYLGGGFQPAIEKASSRAELAVDVADGLPLQPGDPHVWLDPVLFKQVVDRIESALTQVDPAGTDAYRDAADAYRAQLDKLDAEYRAGLADCDRRVLVTGHEAFGYLARRYDLEQAAIAGISPDAEPDPRHLAELADLVRTKGVTTIFTEELVSPKVAETLAREAGIKTEVLHTIEVDEGGGPDQTYLSLMRQNLTRLREALGCR